LLRAADYNGIAGCVTHLDGWNFIQQLTFELLLDSKKIFSAVVL